eukprot:403340094
MVNINYQNALKNDDDLQNPEEYESYIKQKTRKKQRYNHKERWQTQYHDDYDIEKKARIKQISNQKKSKVIQKKLEIDINTQKDDEDYNNNQQSLNNDEVEDHYTCKLAFDRSDKRFRLKTPMNLRVDYDLLSNGREKNENDLEAINQRERDQQRKQLYSNNSSDTDESGEIVDFNQQESQAYQSQLNKLLKQIQQSQNKNQMNLDLSIDYSHNTVTNSGEKILIKSQSTYNVINSTKISPDVRRFVFEQNQQSNKQNSAKRQNDKNLNKGEAVSIQIQQVQLMKYAKNDTSSTQMGPQIIEIQHNTQLEKGLIFEDFDTKIIDAKNLRCTEPKKKTSNTNRNRCYTTLKDYKQIVDDKQKQKLHNQIHTQIDDDKNSNKIIGSYTNLKKLDQIENNQQKQQIYNEQLDQDDLKHLQDYCDDDLFNDVLEKRN